MRRFTGSSFAAWLMTTQPILLNIKIMGMASELDALVKAIQKVTESFRSSSAATLKATWFGFAF